MLKTLLLIALIAPQNLYSYRVVKVIDGDTVEIDAPYLPVELKQTIKLRISGVDTPEKGSRAKCAEEREQADRATQFTQRVVGFSIKHQVTIEGWDKYGGRILGDLILDGKSLKNLLIASGYARPYDGGKKASWCQ